MPRRRLLSVIWVWSIPTVLFLAIGIFAQKPTAQPAQAEDDVVRVNTELVQTDVMVFDRRGSFVDGLRPEQFFLSLSGEKRPITLFSRVTTGTRAEAVQLSAIRTADASATTTSPSIPKTQNPGRLIYLFVDDLHLSAEGIERSRKALLNFVDNRMSANDQVAIVSSSGVIGFLQQLTDNPAVLHEAISRLSYKKNPETTAGRTRISEYMASQVQDGHNGELFAYLMESVKIEFGMGAGALRGGHKNDSAGQATRMLKNRIGQIGIQSRINALNTLAVLQNLMESSAAIPGRKLVFLLSDGFVVDPRGSSAIDVLHDITKVAAKSGAVIYTMDTRGNFMDSSVDASNNDYVDMTSRHAGLSLGETTEPREPLSIMANETGGRAIFNSSSIDGAIRQAVDETSDYYMLAWRPDTDKERVGKARIEVTVAGRPDLHVRLRHSYFTASEQLPEKKKVVVAATTPEIQLLATLGSSYSQRALPTDLSVGYTKATSGYNLQASMQIDREVFSFSESQKNIELDVIGAAIDDRGLIYSFKQLVTVVPSDQMTVPVAWAQQLSVKPGLYQVRIAVRERETGRTGSARQWIEVPNAADDRLALSSLFLGERLEETSRGAESIRVDVDHRFTHDSVLRFQTYVYNATRQPEPDVWIEAQVFRGREEVMKVPAKRVPHEVSKDLGSLPYWSEISLSQLAPGNYRLQVAASERTGNRAATQSTNFTVE